MLLKYPNGLLSVAVRPQPAPDNGVRDGRSNWLAITPTFHRAVLPELHLHGANAGYKSRDLLQPVGSEHATFGMSGQRTAYAASHGTYYYYQVIYAQHE